MQFRYYDNTRLSQFKTCPRSYYFRHVRNWRREGTNPAFAFGIAWHSAMDVVWGMLGASIENKRPSDEVAALAYHRFCESWKEEGYKLEHEMTPEELDDMMPRTPMIAAEMIANYVEHRREFISRSEVISIEQPFAVDLWGGVSSYGALIRYIGRLDKVVRKDARISVIEHKTTTSYQGRAPNHTFKYDYLEQWSPNSQVDGYLYSTHMLYGQSVKNVLVDAALVHKQCHDQFKFIPVERMLEQLDGWLIDARYWVSRVEDELNVLSKSRLDDDPVMTAFPKNTNSCFGMYGQKCTYHDLCKFWVNPEKETLPVGFIEEEWNPFDLLEINKLGLEPETKVE